jgi:putative ATP-dependent endonuclease of OLD family
VEGITEEYFVPASAELLGQNFDDMGVIVCNIHSVNFKPYVQILNALNIPWIILTDGDYYEIVESQDEDGETTSSRKYHIIYSEGADAHYKGHELIADLLTQIGSATPDEIPKEFDKQDDFYRTKGCFVGSYTLEVDMMEQSDNGDLEIIKTIFSDISGGGEKMIENLKKLIDKKDYWTALKRIEQNISKGRFAQRLSGNLSKSMIPSHIKNGIIAIIEKAKENHE